MDLHNDRYFFLSGLISISLFSLLLFVIGYSVLTSVKIEQFAMTQSEFVSVAIDISEAPARTETLAEKAKPAVEPVEEKPAPLEAKKAETVPEISDLFSQVKPQNEPKKKSDDPKKREDFTALEKEIMAPTEKQRFTDKVKSVVLSQPGMKMTVQGGSTGPVVNKYHAKIQGLIHANFHPPAGSAGQKARVLIKISAAGKLISYKVIAYSAHAELNSEVDWLKERLDTVVFPNHPEGRDTELDIILTPEE